MRGKCSWFGGPDDTGMSETETLSLYPDRRGRDLNPDMFYCALRIRWDAVDGISTDALKEFFRDKIKVVVRNPANERGIGCWIVDWGPARSTGRMIDLSPGAMRELGLQTDDDVEIFLLAVGQNASGPGPGMFIAKRKEG